MAEFTNPGSPKFNGQLDSKGRITIPARIRNKLGLEPGDELNLSITGREIKKKQVSNFEEALKFLQQFSNIQNFSFDGETVEVIFYE